MKDQIKKHQECIELLESIQYYEELIQLLESLGIYTKQIVHKRHLYTKCQQRLIERYDKLKATL
jgi:hypothetical protein